MSLESPTSAPFTDLASVYDAIMADVEYDMWAGFVLGLADSYGYGGGRALDLGCGTGNSTAPMVARGMPVEGLDASEAMLAVARAKLPETRFHVGRFETFAVPGTFELAYSVFDSLNNLLSEQALLEACRNVHDHLVPGGVFVFDANTELAMRDLWDGGRVEGWAGDVFYSWRHEYDPSTGLAYVEAMCSSPTGTFVERHAERGYAPADLARVVSDAGFEAVQVVTYPDAAPAGDDADRVWVVARRP